eukprot:g2859.t1
MGSAFGKATSGYEAYALLDSSPEEVQEEKQRVRKWVTNGPVSLSVVCFVVCLVNAGLSSLVFLSNTMSFSLPRAVLSIYVGLFSLFGIVLECEPLICTRRCKARLEYWCKLLQRRWGRGFFYLLVGLMQASGSLKGGGVFTFIAGLFMVGCGIASLIVAFRAGKKLGSIYTQLHKKKSEEELQQTFNKYDTDKSGALDPFELANVAAELGTPLDRNELGAVFALLDSDENGAISFHEFRQWWTGANAINYSMI